MAFFYGLSQVFSRYLKDLDVKFTNAFMGLVGFIILIIISHFFEGNVFHQISNIETNGWLAALYAGAIISIFGHMMMFYLYKFYPVGMVLPFYSLFPVFGLILTFLIFGEIPTLIMVTGGTVSYTHLTLPTKA